MQAYLEKQLHSLRKEIASVSADIIELQNKSSSKTPEELRMLMEIRKSLRNQMASIYLEMYKLHL